MKPIIGINLDHRNAKPGDPKKPNEPVEIVPAVSFAPTRYADAISAAGGTPIFIPQNLSPEQLRHVVGLCAGIVLIGSAQDLDSRRDGWCVHRRARNMTGTRECADRALASLIAEWRVPVLGIGAGMQLMAVTCGATLHLDLPEAYPHGMIHREMLAAPDNGVDRTIKHAIEVEPHTLLGEIYGGLAEVRVLSRHHMAVDDPGRWWTVSARAPDRVIEAIESTDPNWWALGVQWHPHDADASKFDSRVFDLLLEACAAKVTI